MKLIWILAPLLVANLSASATHKKSIAETYGQIPLYFEAIQGQVDSQVRFLSRGRGDTLFLTPSEAVLTLRVPVESEVGNDQPVARTRLKDLKSSLLFQSATVALHAYSGEVLWWTPNESSIQGAVGVANGLFYQGFRNGTLQALDVETGAPCGAISCRPVDEGNRHPLHQLRGTKFPSLYPLCLQHRWG